MRLATLEEGGRDGTLVVVARDGTRFVRATGVAPTLQAALDDWSTLAPRLEALARAAEGGGEACAGARFAAPLPRAYEWLDGSAFLSHVRLARQARGAEMPPDLLHDPLVYQGGSGVLLGHRAPLRLGDPAYGLDLEAELGVIVGDVPAGATPEQAAGAIRLVCLLNDVSLRLLIPVELAKGFGFVQSKPPTAFAPFAITPDELGDAWRDGRVHLPVESFRNGERIGSCHAGEMHFGFPQLISHVARTRPLTAGTIIGSGTVSNEGASHGVSCLVEARMRETIAGGSAATPWLKPGETIAIEVHDSAGRSLFGRIEQEVLPR